jgi:hypothetical protein
VIGLLGVDTEVAGRTYDCGAPLARLGGDDREQDWREYSFLVTSDPALADTPADELPQVACKDKTDDRLTFVYLLGGLGVVLLLVAIVLFFIGRRRPAEATTAPPPGSTTAPPPGSTTAQPPGSTTAPPPGSTTAPPPGSTEA